MGFEAYATLIGKVLANLQGLEFLLRAHLYANLDPPHSPMPPGKWLDSFPVGEEVPVNALTDYDTLGKLISRSDRIVRVRHPRLILNPSIVEPRDAQVHGRVSADHPGDDPVLVKFDKPSGGRTRVAYSQKLTRQWLEDQIKWTRDEGRKVEQAPGSPVVR